MIVINNFGISFALHIVLSHIVRHVLFLIYTSSFAVDVVVVCIFYTSIRSFALYGFESADTKLVWQKFFEIVL